MARTWFRPTAILFMLVLSLNACSPQPAAPASSPTQAPALATAAPVSTAAPTAALSPFEVVREISGGANPLTLPIDFAFGSDGDLYVLDAGDSSVHVFDPTGKSVRTWGGIGSGPGQFSLVIPENGLPYGYGGIAVDKDNNVLVADALNRRVQKFDSTGKFLLQWGSQGEKDGQFFRPLSLALDPAGNIYVIDDRRNVIQEFDPNGNFIKKFGEDGTGNGQLSDTGNISIGPDGNLYVADFGNRRVEVFSLDGKFVRTWRTSSRPVSVVVDSQGRAFVTDEGSVLTEYDQAGKEIYAGNTLGLSDPMTVDIDSSGLMYVADQRNHRVLVFKEK